MGALVGSFKNFHGGMVILKGKIIFLFMLLSLVVFGCSPESGNSSDENTTMIKTVLTEQLTGPDERFIELVEDPANVTVIGEGKTFDSQTNTELELYLEETYKSYFTENFYDTFIGLYAINFQAALFNNNYEMNVESIDTKKNRSIEGAYDFTVHVTYKQKDQEAKDAELSGRAYIYEEGKIADLMFAKDNDLPDELKQ
ncbi:hypothetical protein [Oceanobacillus limi]|uniref:hypothetical protein n=1 Tax=Oceanobacillus limi TaxID=930131 RepID=UPI00147A54FF|nr:hypothetical protein [Oceanobacillus limi]